MPSRESDQTVTIPNGAAQPATGDYFVKEDLDFSGFSADANFGGTKLGWKGCRTLAEAKAGTAWRTIEWEGTAKEVATGTAGNMVGVDPLHFSIALYLIPVSDANQAGADCVVTGYFRKY